MRRRDTLAATFLGTLAAFTLGLLAASAAGATPPTVFLSPNDDGVAAGDTMSVPIAGDGTLHLYFSTGGVASTTGTPCIDGDGDEVCAVDVTIDQAGDASLLSFTPAGNVVFALSANRLRLNAGNPLSGDLGVVKLGDLVVDTSQAGIVELDASFGVSAAQVKESGNTGFLATVPEPGLGLGVAMGSLLSLLGAGAKRPRPRHRRPGAAGDR